MSRFDYKLIRALSAVIQEQSFERAAKTLFITQSAISQRLKLLEHEMGQPVLIRSTPIKATEVGEKLLKHFYQVDHLEKELEKQIFPDTNINKVKIHIAVNTDSLATWFLTALSSILKKNSLIELNLLLADEANTIEKLKSGEAFGAVTLQEKPEKACQSDLIGTFRYSLVATPAFAEKHFPNGVTAEAIASAPSAAFDQRDVMHTDFIHQHFGLEEGDYPLHRIRSTEAFVKLVKSGMAFCLVSDLLILDELSSGELVSLLPDFQLEKKLYWQRWALLRGAHKEISDAILNEGKALLSQIHAD
ncbi:LysR family transcriptional regulator ArgP [Alteromonas facilis]|uniref:LysR family transcriptional regulator ArgP n=1 Tax=Alteromonas facilis TaxID=2048004 RepID=UPI000C28F8F6|nr:LysR family transcriptional regulator ArgP [Alteromonas facilis]